MALIKGEYYFNFDGISSKKWDLMIVNLNNGMYEDMFLSNRSISTQKPHGRTKTMLQKIEEEDISFELELAFMKGFNDQIIEEVALWLRTNYYRPFYFENRPDRLMYAMVVDESLTSHMGVPDNNEGYIKIKVQTNSAKMFSQKILTSKYPIPSSGTYDINFEIKGHEETFPEISITTKAKDILFETVIDGKVDNIFEIHNLTKGEGLYLDCYRETIESEIVGVFHYDDTIGHYPTLPLGSSKLRITGECEIQLRYQHIFVF